jgi:hypothetical protein
MVANQLTVEGYQLLAGGLEAEGIEGVEGVEGYER